MAYAETQPTVTLIAETTFSAGDLYKFLAISTANGRVSIAATTDQPSRVIGTLLSETYTTSTGPNGESVTVGLLQGVGKVNMAASTESAGTIIGASSLGLGVLSSTAYDAIGYIVDGSSGGVGRINSVLFMHGMTT